MTTAEKEVRHRLPVGPRLKSVLKTAYRTRRPVLLEGPTGVGKSEVVREVAQELEIGWAVLDLSLLEPPDLVGLPVIENGRTSYASPQILPLAGNGILMLEELNRAERYIQQPALQLLTARRLHQYTMPDGWSVVAAINPEKGDYQVTPLDPALRCRFLQLYVSADCANWMAWAEKTQIHPAVPPPSSELRPVFGTGSPTNLDLRLTTARRHPSRGIGKRRADARLAARLPSTANRRTVAADFGGRWHRPYDQRREAARDVPQDSKLREKIRALREGGQTDRLHEIACQIRTIIEGPELNQLIGRGDFSLDAFEMLLTDLPGDHRDAPSGASL